MQPWWVQTAETAVSRPPKVTNMIRRMAGIFQMLHPRISAGGERADIDGPAGSFGPWRIPQQTMAAARG